MIGSVKNNWSIKAYGWNSWGVYLNDLLVANSNLRHDCVVFMKLHESIRLQRIASDYLSRYRPLQLSTSLVFQ